MHNMNRSARRKAIQSAKRKQKLTKAGAITLATLVASSGMVSAHAATTTNKVDIGHDDYMSSWEFKGNTKGLNDTELDKALRSAVGVMDGTVKLSMSDADQKKLKDAGITLNLASSEKLTNEQIKKDSNTNISMLTPYNYSLQYDLTFDESKMKSVAKDMGLSFKEMAEGDDEFNELNQYNFGHINGRDDAVENWNIMTDDAWKKPSQKKGNEVTYMSVAGLNDGDILDGVAQGASTFPVSTAISGGVLEADPVSEITGTTLVDPYSDGDDEKRRNDVDSTSPRAMSGTISNCVLAGADCGVWFALSVSHDGGTTLLTDPVRLNVESTVSAGKTPTSMITKSGAKVDFKPEAYPLDTAWQDKEDSWFLASNVGDWQFAQDYKELLASLTEATTNITDVDFDGSSVILNADSKVGVSYGSKLVDKNTIHLTLEADKKTEWQWGGNMLDGADFGIALPVAKGITMEWKEISDTQLVVEFVKAKGWDDEGQVDANIQLGVATNWFGGGQSMAQTPTVYSMEISYDELEKPVEPKPEPKPEPLPKPEAVKDSKTGKQGNPVTVPVLDNDKVSDGFALVDGSLKLINKEGKAVSKVVIPEQGTYEVVGSEVVFTPLASFVGKADVLKYEWVETNGTVEQGASSTVQVTITGETKPEVPTTPTPEPEVPVIPEPTPPTETPESTPEPDPIETPESDEQEPELTPPTPTPEKEVEITDPPVDEGDSDKDPEPKVEESINNSGVSTGTLALLGVSLAGFFAGVITLFSRKDKKAKGKHTN